MSYILDALRKAEHANARIAKTSQAGHEHPSSYRKGLGIGVIVGLMCVSVAALTWIALNPTHMADMSTEKPSEWMAGHQAVEQPASFIRGEVRPLKQESRMTSTPTTTSQTATPSAQPYTLKPVPPKGIQTEDDYASLRASGVDLPDMNMNLHVFHESPAKRFIFIDNVRYGQGDRLTNGMQLLEITPHGAVFNDGKRRFSMQRR